MFKRITQVFSGIKYIGADQYGNKYFTSPLQDNTRSLRDTLSVAKEEKRWVEYKDQFPDVHSVPVLWRQWLNYRRVDPPTEKELNLFDQKAVLFAQKVKEIEDEDAKLRLQQVSSGFFVDAKANAPDFGSFSKAVMNENVNSSGNSQIKRNEAKKETQHDVRHDDEDVDEASEWRPPSSKK